MRRMQTLGLTVLMLVFAGSTIAHAQGRGRGEEKKKQAEQSVSPQEQQQRAQQEQQRAAQYRQRLDAQVRVAQQQAAQLQQQKRVAQARAQEQYAAQLRQQQQQLQASRDYARDPYVTTPHTYRYVVSGTSRQTNQYGADVLRQAVNNGYQQGFRAGEADREDHRRSSYSTTFGYRDANFGYGGNYVDQNDYNYYFRQGFRRGYEDGYNRRTQYGTVSNGNPSILSTLLTTILGLQPIR